MFLICAVCMQAMIMTHSVRNVPSQQAVKLVLVGRGLVKNGVSWGNGFAIGDTSTKIVP